MRGNIVWAAAILGGCLVVASGLMVWGVSAATDRAAGRLEAATREHARFTERAGAEAGVEIREAINGLAVAAERHAASVERAGKTIAEPAITMKAPLAVEQPLRVVGPREDGALPVNARVAK